MVGLSGVIGPDVFSDPAGFAYVSAVETDIFLLHADVGPELDGFERQFSGFSIEDSAGKAWMAINFRVQFLAGDFLVDNSLPGSLPEAGPAVSRFVLDFLDTSPEYDAEGDIINGANMHSVYFDATSISPVPLPAAAWLLISALGGLVIAKHRQRRML
ncbi:VPLPA-CTERM sorting domain-containing protein [Halieaceae bacterium IMCC14734]|uniref:VPLPA-CTERM sorting domain-containing protein n=2 Tax=Candidatus Litorirhabdus singularis TaxID=2518993 RepID=A0ABT3TKR1_9GAMM|nr:VPLPA-CTERM sorting domain-containing protein [Candidatus Litorirhabdus singularis]